MDTLPKELKQRIFSLLPRSQLKQFFDDEAIGTACKTRYYDTIALEELDVHDSEFEILDLDGEYSDSQLFTNPLTEYVEEWHGDAFNSVRFYYVEHFLDFFRKNKDVMTFNRLELNHTEYYFQIAERCPEVFDKVKFLDVGCFFFDLGGRDDFRSAEAFKAAASALIARFGKFPVPESLRALRLFFPYRVSGQRICFEPDLLIDKTIDRSRLTVLSMSNVLIENMENFLFSVPNLKELMFRSVPIEDVELPALPRSLRHLTLLSAVKINSTKIHLKFPEELRFLKIDCLEYAVDSKLPLQIDLSHLKRLVALHLGNCCIESLEDLRLPKCIQHFLFSYSNVIRDLKSLETYEKLISFTCNGCLSLSFSPFMFGKQKFPERLMYFAVGDFSSYDAERKRPAIGDDLENHYFVDMVEEREVKYLLLDYRTRWPLKVKRITINNPSLVIDSTAFFPDSLEELKLDGIHKILDVGRLIFPKNLKTLRIIRADIEDLNDAQFPQSLSTLEVLSCKVSSIRNSNLKTLKHLKMLSFAWNALDDSSNLFDELPSDLEELALFGNPLTKFDVVRLSKLVKLVINSCNLPCIDEEVLKLPDSLQILEANSNKIEWCSESFNFPSRLKSLQLFRNSMDVSENFFAQLPSTLQTFLTTGKKEITSEERFSLPSDLREFKYIHHARWVAAPTFKTTCPNLKELFISNVTVAIFDLSSLPPAIEDLGLIDNRFDDIQGDLKHLQNLHNFSLSCFNMEYKSIRLTFPVNIQQIELCECNIEEVKSHIDFSLCRRMVSLNLDNNDELNVASLVEAVKELKKLCPAFHTVTLYEELITDDLETQLLAVGVVARVP